MKTSEKLLRYVYVYFFFILTIFISSFFLNFVQCILYFTLKPRNKELYRKINYYLCYMIYSQMMFLAEWYANARVVLYINKKDYDTYFGKESAYVISNHKYEIDWLMLGILSERANCGGNFKAYMKKSLQYAPAIGWSLFFSENVFLERSFEKDKPIIHRQINELANYKDPMWLIMYPEGTRYTKEKHEVSLKVAKEKGLPELKYLLTPRCRGFVTSLTPMHNKIPALYDATVTFRNADEMQPTLNNTLQGGKMECNIFLRRIPFDKVPLEESEATEFLYELFRHKDKIHGSFLETGDYFTNSGVEKVEKIEFKPSIWVLINSLFWHTVVMVPLFYYLFSMLFTASFYQIFVTYGGLFLFSFILSRTFSFSQTKKGSTYGIEKKKVK